ncbi:hypothetical protein GCM10027037_13170 [Mucilaginibacter koreensis]
METPKKPVKKSAAKTSAKTPGAKAAQPKPKRRFDDDDEDDDEYSMPLEDIDYDSLRNYDDED